MQQPTLMQRPPKDAFAAAARSLVADHGDWDQPHRLVSLVWDGHRLNLGTVAIITPDVSPDLYARVIAEFAEKETAALDRGGLYGYALQIEGYAVVEPTTGATSAERRQFDSDRFNRRLNTRPDAVEQAMAYAADIHGRAWSATVRRDEPGIQETFHRPGEIGGRFITSLLAAAYATGHVRYGLPIPAGL